MTYIGQKDMLLEYAREGNAVNKFGENYNSAADVPEYVWDGGGIYVFPTTADMTHISQDSNQLALLGGTINIEGLDINFNTVIQDVNLNATNTTTPVALSTPLLRVSIMKVNENVIGNSAVTLHNVANTQTYAIIQAGNNQSLMAIYTVPAGKTAYMTAYYCNYTEIVNRDPESIRFVLLVADRANGYEFQVKHTGGVQKGAILPQYHFRPYFKITEKSDIVILAIPNNKPADVHAGFDLILEDKQE